MKGRPDFENKVWRPGLVQLTMIGNPDVDEGQPTPAYVSPDLIALVYRGLGSFFKAGTNGKEYHPQVPCTTVQLTTGNHLMCLETPQEVASRRDQALGLPPPGPRPVK